MAIERTVNFAAECNSISFEIREPHRRNRLSDQLVSCA
ncbi:hypothetical protein SS05631_c20330 [Sinorhizobium sp. CCBAU 05631]|nr:hypothetical protein SS05631_c20330 [Sinorhizobium sp. CCBAU 05631]